MACVFESHRVEVYVRLTRLTRAFCERFPKLQNIVWRTAWKGHPPGHFYSPIPSKANRENGVAAHTGVDDFGRATNQLRGIDLRSEHQRELLEQLTAYASEFAFPQQQSPDFRFYRDNGFYTDPDAITLFCMLRHLSPRNVVEVGSGHSSALILDTAERFLNHEIDCTFIDPHPERLLQVVAETDSSADILQIPVQSVDPSVFDRLDDGDILLIDSSHVLKHGSDVCHLLFEVLPNLNSGVYIHFHDTCYPFEYPRSWLTDGRAWNEAYALRCFLECNSQFQIALWNHFAGMAFPQSLQPFAPYFRPGDGSSLWIRRTKVAK